tara:strand:+ start:123 stop:281 length:159 start_codon:yes stop_codon:yes gene_type:complete
MALSKFAQDVLVSRFGEIREVFGGCLLPSRNGLEKWTTKDVENFAHAVGIKN